MNLIIDINSSKIIKMKPCLVSFVDSFQKQGEVMEKVTTEVDVTFYKEQASELQSIFPFIKQWKVQTLLMNSLNDFLILEEIRQICFPALIELSLDKNGIEGIEIICQLNFPFLLKLYLGNNEIFSVRELRKCNFLNLELLRLYNNRIKQFPNFAQMRSPELKYLSFEYQNDHPEQSCDLRFMGKSQTKQFTYVYIYGQARIEQKLTLATLQKKCFNANFYS